MSIIVVPSVTETRRGRGKKEAEREGGDGREGRKQGREETGGMEGSKGGRKGGREKGRERKGRGEGRRQKSQDEINHFLRHPTRLAGRTAPPTRLNFVGLCARSPYGVCKKCAGRSLEKQMRCLHVDMRIVYEKCNLQ